MGNRCCDGGNKQKDTPVESPQHNCQATNEISRKYGTIMYTCQSTRTSAAMAKGGLNGTSAASMATAVVKGGRNGTSVDSMAAAAAKGGLNGTSAASMATAVVKGGRTGTSVDSMAAAAAKGGLNGTSAASGATAVQASTAKVLQIGGATADQLRAILAAAPPCFDAHPVDSSNQGRLRYTLGVAVRCVQDEMEKSWGVRVDVLGSVSCGQCAGHGLGATVVEVAAGSGTWSLVMKLK